MERARRKESSKLAMSQEWQWIIEYVQDNFSLDDVCNWDEFHNQDRNLREGLLLLIFHGRP